MGSRISKQRTARFKLIKHSKDTIERLDDQIEWYDLKSAASKKGYFWLKSVSICAAAAVPVIAASNGPHLVTACIGAVVVCLEGILGLTQIHQNWVGYRSTAEALKHDKYLYQANAGPYASAVDPLTLLAERIEGIVSQEHAKWVTSREDKGNQKAKN